MIKSNLDVAYDIMQKSESPISFQKLWEDICKIQEFDEEESKKRMGKFYTNLFMDGRFIFLAGNNWNLRDRYKFQSDYLDEEFEEADDSANDDNLDEEEEDYDDDSHDEDEDEDYDEEDSQEDEF